MTRQLLVYNQFAGRLDSVDGKLIGAALVDDSYDPLGSDATVGSITGEVSGTGYARGTFTAEWDAATLTARVASEAWPTFDISATATPVTGVVFYWADTGGDANKLISFIPYEEQDPVVGWVLQPLNGFARATPGALLDERLAVVEAWTVAGVPFVAGDVPTATLAAALGVTGGGSPTGAAGGDLGGTYPNPTVPGLASKVTANGAITGATKTKITYDAKGLVTAGADATASDVGAVPSSYLDTDGTLAANSDTKVATQKAVKTFVAGALPTGQVDFTTVSPADGDTVTVSTTTVTVINVPTGGSISVAYPANCPMVWYRIYVPASQVLGANVSGGSDPFGLYSDSSGVLAWVVGNEDGHLVLPGYAVGYASEAYADAAAAAAAAALVDSAPGTLDTLNELAAALGDDPNFATSTAAAIAAKATILDLYLTAGDGIHIGGTGFFTAPGSPGAGNSPAISVDFYGSNPEPLGVANPGDEIQAAHGNHVHPMPTAAQVGAPSGSGTSTGTNTGDQTITLTGDVTGSGTGSFATAIGSSKVTSAMIVDGTIVNADINGSAAIALSKLATDPLARANHTGNQTASTISDFDTQVRTSRLDQMAAPTADVSANSHKVTNVTTPTASSDAATKGYVDLRDLSVTATKTANYTAAAGEYVPVDTTSGVIVITLPTAPADGTVVAVKRVAGTTNAVTVNTAGSDVFNVSGGVTTGSLSVLNQAFEMIYRATGAIWVVNTSLALSQLDVRFAPATLVSSDQSGTTYTTVLADANTLVRFTNAALVTVTIPTNASVAYPLNTILTLHARGAAGGTLAAAGGVTIRNNSTATFAQYAEISVRKDGTDEWIRVG